MGFSGHLVFGRSERALWEAPVFGGVDEALVHAWEARPGGWQTLQVVAGACDVEWDGAGLAALVEWSGAPACVAEVSDSSVALVTGLDTEGGAWQAWLNIDAAASLLVEEPEDLDDQLLWLDTPEFDEAVRRMRAVLEAEAGAGAAGAVAWAVAAGVSGGPRPGGVEALLRSDAVFVEELFSELLDRLGFPRAA